MNKWYKVVLTLIISIILYIGLYYLMMLSATAETYSTLWYTYLDLVIYAIVAIPLGMLSFHLFQKWIKNPQKRIIPSTCIVVIYGALYGWITLTGLILGEFLIEKKTDTKYNLNNKLTFHEFKNLKPFNWLLVIVISLVLIALPLVIYSLYSLEFQQGSASSIGLVGVTIFILVSTFINENKNDYVDFGFQKSIIFVIILYLVMIASFFYFSYTQIPLDKEERLSYDFEEAFVSGADYYFIELSEIEENILLAMEKEDYMKARSLMPELERLYTEQAEFMLDKCEEAETNSINLSGSEELQTLQVVCDWQDVFEDCKDERIRNTQLTIDLFEHMDTRSYSDCLEVFHPAKVGGDCFFLDQQLGQSYQGLYDSQAEEYCRELFLY